MDNCELSMYVRTKAFQFALANILKFIKGTAAETFIASISNGFDYEGYLLYFGIREQKQTLIIENRFIVFQNIPH